MCSKKGRNLSNIYLEVRNWAILWDICDPSNALVVKLLNLKWLDLINYLKIQTNCTQLRNSNELDRVFGKLSKTHQTQIPTESNFQTMIYCQSQPEPPPTYGKLNTKHVKKVAIHRLEWVSHSELPIWERLSTWKVESFIIHNGNGTHASDQH